MGTCGRHWTTCKWVALLGAGEVYVCSYARQYCALRTGTCGKHGQHAGRWQFFCVCLCDCVHPNCNETNITAAGRLCSKAIRVVSSKLGNVRSMNSRAFAMPIKKIKQVFPLVGDGCHTKRRVLFTLVTVL
jgi:hypothetical protein